MGEVLFILQDQIRRYGGAYGVRDLDLLSSALAMPSASFEGKYLHKDLYEQAAAYAFHICQNHPFIDGNKRTGLATALVFLALNGIDLDDSKEELYELMMDVSGKGKAKAAIARPSNGYILEEDPRDRLSAWGRNVVGVCITNRCS